MSKTQESYYRYIQIEVGSTRVTADMEDNFHRFTIQVDFENGVVTDVSGNAGRIPWTTCGEPLDYLKQFRGLKIEDPEIKPTLDTICTHQFDLFRLALDHLQQNLGSCRYRIKISGEPSKEHAELNIDQTGLSWHWTAVDSDKLIQPDRLNGLTLSTLPSWAGNYFQGQELIAARLLRRAFHIARGRFVNQDAWNSAADINAPPTCYSFQSNVAKRAIRNVGSGRDFTHQEQLVLVDVDSL